MPVAAAWIILGAAALLYLGFILAGLLAAVPVDGAVSLLFDEPFLTRAAAYQRAGLAISLLQQLLSLLFLAAAVYLVMRFFKAAPHPALPYAAGYIVLFLIAQRLLSLPLDFYRGYTIEHRFGLSIQTAAGWFADYGKSALIGLFIAAAALTGLYVLITRWPARWWFFGGIAFTLFLLLSGYLYPLIIDPLFYRFTDLEGEGLPERITGLSEKAGIRVERILVADAGRRTSKANAYFSGMGRTRRIVIYDTLLQNFTDEEVLAVIAHEMGHWRHGHLWRNVLLGAAGSFAALYALYCVLLKMGLHADFRALPLALLFFALLSMAVSPARSALSRSLEREADRTALSLIGESAPFVSLYCKLARSNLSVVQPHPLLKAALYTHPPLMERIEAARREGGAIEGGGKR